jgi:hypothetical protein
MADRGSIHAGSAADALAGIVLPDQDGEPVTLGDLWRERPVALVWLSAITSAAES